MRTRNRLTQLLVSSALLLATTASAQVTIGSNDVPVHGALLQLKETNGAGANSKQGLGMPRVKLTTRTDLDDVLNAADKTGNYKEMHTGLTVYHADKCTLSGSGIYVWTGEKWEILGEDIPAGLTLSKDTIDLPSGQDLRPFTSKTLTVNWRSGNNSIAPTWTTTPNNGLAAVPFTTNPLLPTTLTNSPTDMTLLPNAMTAAEIQSKPWLSKETKLAFTYDACGQTKEVILNQTNYALKVNNYFNNSKIVYTTANTGSFQVQGNVTWIATVNDPKNVIASTTPTIPAGGLSGGKTLKNGTTASPIPSFSFTTNAGSRYDVANITFKDAHVEKRFNDITVSILNCGTSTQNDPTMGQWAMRAGFTVADTLQVTAGETLLDSDARPKTTPNGIQLHRDQDGNIFLSGVFGKNADGSENRWMLNNLSAKKYTTTGRTGDDKQQNKAMPANPSVLTEDFANPRWGYPHIDNTSTNATTFKNNRRMGLLYNWAAATNGKGRYDVNGNQINALGQASINDGEKASDPNNDPQTTKIQGICPNGWHLPSDWEWTQLEQEISTNTSKYASIPDAGAKISIGNIFYRGTTHGLGMRDACQVPGQTVDPSNHGNGASNVISDLATVLPGFNAMLVYSYGTLASFWSASSDDKGYPGMGAWSRTIAFADSRGIRDAVITGQPPYRYTLVSVRCKKDKEI